MTTEYEKKIFHKAHEEGKISAKAYFLFNEDRPGVREFDQDISKAVFELKSIYLYRDDMEFEKLCHSVAACLKRFCEILNENPDFKDLEFGFCELASILGVMDSQGMAEAKQKEMRRLIDAMVKDIKKWYIYVFQTKYAIDIHYMDGSLMNTFFAFREIIACEETEAGEVLLF